LDRFNVVAIFWGNLLTWDFFNESFFGILKFSREFFGFSESTDPNFFSLLVGFLRASVDKSVLEPGAESGSALGVDLISFSEQSRTSSVVESNAPDITVSTLSGEISPGFELDSLFFSEPSEGLGALVDSLLKTGSGAKPELFVVGCFVGAGKLRAVEGI